MSLEKKKKKMELARVELARMELQLKIEERLEEIKRLEDHIKVQLEKEISLSAEIEKIQ